MRFNIAKDDLLAVLNIVSKGMSSRSTLPILSGILVNAGADSVIFQSTDLEISIKHTAPADVVETGSTVIPGKLFGDIVKSLPDAVICIVTENDQASISCMDSSFTLSTMNPVDFPYFPNIEPETSVVLPSAAMADVVKKVGRAVSRDEARAILTGILFTVSGDNVRMAATDSYRLAVADLPIQGQDIEDFQAIIPGKIFEDVSRLASSEETVTVNFSENQIVFSFGSTILVSRKIEGTYPNYNQLLPKDHSVRIQVDSKELVTAVKRASLLAQSHTPVKFSFSAEDQQITLTARTQDIGGAREVISAQIEGEDMDIAFNHQYILDGLGCISGDVVIELQTSLKPGILKEADKDGFLYLAMPVRLG